jgi:hypothetical protein
MANPAPIAPAKPVNKTERKARKPVDPNETPAQRFVRLANRRVGKALNVLGHIASLGNRRQYEYSQEQVAKIKAALTAAVGKINSAFDGSVNVAATFTL